MNAPAVTWPRLADLRFSKAEIVGRQAYLGASDLYRLRRGQWRQLWQEKTGRRKPDDLSGVLRVQLGLWCEEFARQWIEEQLDLQIDRDDRLHVDPERPWRRTHTDGFIRLPDGRKAVLEAKYTGQSPERVLDTYLPQLHHEMACTGCEVAFLAALHTDDASWSFVQVELDPDFLFAVTSASEEFWSHVEADREPRNQRGPLF